MGFNSAFKGLNVRAIYTSAIGNEVVIGWKLNTFGDYVKLRNP